MYGILQREHSTRSQVVVWRKKGLSKYHVVAGFVLFSLFCLFCFLFLFCFVLFCFLLLLFSLFFVLFCFVFVLFFVFLFCFVLFCLFHLVELHGYEPGFQWDCFWPSFFGSAQVVESLGLIRLIIAISPWDPVSMTITVTKCPWSYFWAFCLFSC